MEYWNNTGRYSTTAIQLQKLIPSTGAVCEPERNKALEKLRKATNVYYDYNNNALANRAGEVRKLFGFSALAMARQRDGELFHHDIQAAFEAGMDAAILSAADEQGIDVVELPAHQRLARRAKQARCEIPSLAA